MTEDEKPLPSTAESSRAISPDVIQLLPKLLWFAFAVVVFALSYRPVLTRLEEGQVAKVAFATFQIEFARQAVTEAGDQPGRKGAVAPQEFRLFADRIQRQAEKIYGARGLWISDSPVTNFPERRALTALGLSFDQAKTTEEAQELFDEADRMNSPYDFVISDIHRDPNIDPIVAPCFPFAGSPKEAGCHSLQVVVGRYEASPIPFIFYSLDSKGAPTPAGAFGAADRIDTLISLVLDAVERRHSREGQPFAN